MILTIIVSFILFVVLLATVLTLRKVNGWFRLPLLLSSSTLMLPVIALFLYLVSMVIIREDESRQVSLFDGGELSSFYYSKNVYLSLLKIDLSRVTIQITGGENVEGSFTNLAQTSSQALAKYDRAVAINASFFTPFRDNHLFDYYPHKGDVIYPIGRTMVDGVLHGRYEYDWPKFIVNKQGKVAIISRDVLSISDLDFTLSNLKTIVSGRSRLLNNGKIFDDKNLPADAYKKYPRTALGIHEDGEKIIVVTVDGKQPGHSEGMTLIELSKFLKSLGVRDAIELDGGGSSVMAYKENGRIEKLNRSIHTKIPNRERPIANHLVFSPKR